MRSKNQRLSVKSRKVHKFEFIDEKDKGLTFDCLWYWFMLIFFQFLVILWWRLYYKLRDNIWKTHKGLILHCLWYWFMLMLFQFLVILWWRLYYKLRDNIWNFTIKHLHKGKLFEINLIRLSENVKEMLIKSRVRISKTKLIGPSQVKNFLDLQIILWKLWRVLTNLVNFCKLNSFFVFLCLIEFRARSSQI